MRSFAIVPAAGKSQRMGQPKLLLPAPDGRPLIQIVVTAWLASNVDHIAVVIRADDQELHDVISALSSLDTQRLSIVRATPPPQDMRASIQAGLNWLKQQGPMAPGSSDVWLVAPADLPKLDPLVINQLLANYAVDSPQIL
ncbi:MAG: NTP transferase domain-containing protein, partial [Planctomycetales bacterium]|nr:NTP transferase domain-containing protein [Planctomycetales bacterium]